MAYVYLDFRFKPVSFLNTKVYFWYSRNGRNANFYTLMQCASCYVFRITSESVSYIKEEEEEEMSGRSNEEQWVAGTEATTTTSWGNQLRWWKDSETKDGRWK